MNFDRLLELDRKVLLFFNGSESPCLDTVVLTLTSGLTWIPLYLFLLYLAVRSSRNAAQFGLVVAGVLLCLLISDGMADFIVKPAVARLRPANEPLLQGIVDVVGDYRETSSYSFFSAHASNTMSVAVFFCLLLRSGVLSAVLISWSLLNCWTRLYLGVHYPSDILVGLVWGLFAGWSGYRAYRFLHLKTCPE